MGHHGGRGGILAAVGVIVDAVVQLPHRVEGGVPRHGDVPAAGLFGVILIEVAVIGGVRGLAPAYEGVIFPLGLLGGDVHAQLAALGGAYHMDDGLGNILHLRSIAVKGQGGKLLVHVGDAVAVDVLAVGGVYRHPAQGGDGHGLDQRGLLIAAGIDPVGGAGGPAIEHHVGAVHGGVGGLGLGLQLVALLGGDHLGFGAAAQVAAVHVIHQGGELQAQHLGVGGLLAAFQGGGLFLIGQGVAQGQADLARAGQVFVLGLGAGLKPFDGQVALAGEGHGIAQGGKLLLPALFQLEFGQDAIAALLVDDVAVQLKNGAFQLGLGLEEDHVPHHAGVQLNGDQAGGLVDVVLLGFHQLLHRFAHGKAQGEGDLVAHQDCLAPGQGLRRGEGQAAEAQILAAGQQIAQIGGVIAGLNGALQELGALQQLHHRALGGEQGGPLVCHILGIPDGTVGLHGQLAVLAQAHGGEAAEVAQLRAPAQGQAALVSHGDDGVLHQLGLLFTLIGGLPGSGRLGGGGLFALALFPGLLGQLKEAALVAAGIVQDHVHQQQAARLPLRALGSAQLDHGGVIVLVLQVLGGLEILGALQGDGLARRQDGNVLPDEAGGFLHLQIRHHQDVNRPVGGLVGRLGRPGQALEGRLLGAVAALIVSVLGDIERHFAQQFGHRLLCRLLRGFFRRLLRGLLLFALLGLLRGCGLVLLGCAGILRRFLGKGGDRQRHQQGEHEQQCQGTLADLLHGRYPPVGL